MRVLIFGAGHLGLKVASEFRSRAPDLPMTCITRTTQRHEQIRKIGARPGLEDETEGRYSTILFSVPPTQSGYVALLNSVLEKWDRQAPFVFTSSTAVYPQRDGSWVDEDSPIDAHHILSECEKMVSEAGGVVARLAGLYDLKRGPHQYYFNHQSLSTFGGEWINLIHTDDATQGLNLLLRGEVHSQLYNVCDGEPITRDLLCQAAYDAYKKCGYPAEHRCQFVSKDNSPGKRVKVKNAIAGFKLRYPSFLGWLETI